MTVFTIVISINPKSKILQFNERKFDEDCDDDVYKERHRIPREAVDYLEEKLSPKLTYESRRNRPLTPRQQVQLISYKVLGVIY